MSDLNTSQLIVLMRAARRSNRCICPTPHIRGAAQKAMLKALAAKGLIDLNDGHPVINDAGLAVLKSIPEVAL